MNLGKDIKLGDDKRQVSIIESSEQDIYNIANGEPLTDEFGNQLITEVDNFFLPDVSKKRATSVVFAEREGSYIRTEEVSVASTTATYPNISQNNIGISTANINVGDTIVGSSIPDATFISRIGIGSVYVSNFLTNAAPITEIVSVKRKTQIRARSNPVIKIQEEFKEASEVSTTLLGISRAEVQLSLFSNVSSYGIDPDEFEFYSYNSGNSFNSWENRSNKIYGNRYLAKLTEETQESAIQLTAFPAPYSYPFGPKFQRLGSYNQTLFERYQRFIALGNALYDYYNTGGGSYYPSEWKNKFLSKNTSYIFNDDVVYAQGTTISFAQIDTWTDTWRDIKDSQLKDPITSETFNFGKVTEVLSGINPDDLSNVGLDSVDVNSTNTRPGYSDGEQRYAYLQSRRVFRYQPGRISGFTFGVRTSAEPVSGIVNEWGISNPTDQYVFRIEAGQFSIVRRSTIPLEQSVLLRNGLKLEDQTRIPSGDPFDSEQYWTIEIPRDKFNGDALDSNGPSGYLLKPENVTMYKIEFGWYGAIGARFYAYIPTDNGEARWVVIHTLVIENSLGAPCLEDSYFRLKYSVNIQNTGDVRTPQYLYKYGASYYIDGGDDGTTQIYSVSSKQKTISSSSETSLIGIRPKQVLLNKDGVPIINKKLIIPTELNVSSDSLSEIKVVTCTACPGFGHVYTPGVATTESGRYVDIEFSDQNTIGAITAQVNFLTSATSAGQTVAIGGTQIFVDSVVNVAAGSSLTITGKLTGVPVVSVGNTFVFIGTSSTISSTITAGLAATFSSANDSYFYKSDIGAKIIAPSLYNAYITGVSDPVGTSGSYLSAAIKGFGGYISLNLVDRNIGGSLVLDRVTGTATTVGFGTDLDATYPYPIRLSNYDVYAASSVKLFGSTIDIQFANPNSQDSYAHFADFLIGITDLEPDISAPDILNGFITGTGTTTILPNTKILFGEHTHSFAGIDEDGVETGEGWSVTDPPFRMGISSRIPALSNPGGGICSKLTINVLEPLLINDVNEFNYRPNTPPIPDPQGRRWIQIQGVLPPLDYDGGQIAIVNPSGTVSVTGSRFVGVTSSYTSSGRRYSFIQISQTLSQGPDFTIAIRPLQATGSLVNSTKLFNYNPYPLYLVAKLKDYASINNISIRETVGDNQRTVSPILYVSNNSGITSVTNADGNANIAGEPPTDFREILRSSSALIDLQNNQKLRPYVERDTLYVGANSTQTIDLTPVFGTDKRVIAPDNNNIEATFVLARKIDEDGFGSVETSINFKEQ
jgi:hypothetical protein